jgi:hypothetical protein
MRHGEINSEGQNICIPAASGTRNLNSSMSVSEMQAVIDGVDKYIPNGRIITFQFADGTYNIGTKLTFQGFYGGGRVYIYGNTSETDATVLHTSQQVYINGSTIADNDGVIRIYENSCFFIVRNLKFQCSATTAHTCIIGTINSRPVDVRYCYLFGSTGGTNNTKGVGYSGGDTGGVTNTYVSNTRYGIVAGQNSVVQSNGNDDTGTAPNYGLSAQAGIIMKLNTQPNGTVADEHTYSGGVIR